MGNVTVMEMDLSAKSKHIHTIIRTFNDRRMEHVKTRTWTSSSIRPVMDYSKLVPYHITRVI